MSKSIQGVISPIATSPSIFNFGAHSVRIIVRDSEPWFVAADVCTALAISNATMALRVLDDDEKDTLSLTEGIHAGRSGNPNVAIISESGMYTLVLRCRNAVKSGSVLHKFRKWVTSEVLPSLRTKGEYVSQSQQSEMVVAQAYANAAYAADIVSRHVFNAVINGSTDPFHGRWLLETHYAGPNRQVVPSIKEVPRDALMLPVEEFVDAFDESLVVNFGTDSLVRLINICSSSLRNRAHSRLQSNELQRRIAERNKSNPATATAVAGSKR